MSEYLKGNYTVEAVIEESKTEEGARLRPSLLRITVLARRARIRLCGRRPRS